MWFEMICFQLVMWRPWEKMNILKGTEYEFRPHFLCFTAKASIVPKYKSATSVQNGEVQYLLCTCNS